MAQALVLFDIDGTLVRKAGPEHRQALVQAVKEVVGIEAGLDHIPVQGMLDQDILRTMLRDAGLRPGRIREALPALQERAQAIYVRHRRDLRRKVCPGVRRLLGRLTKAGVPMALVTGNLTRIGWHKVDRAGLRPYFAFGSFSETARTRAGLAKQAVRHARREGWIGRGAKVSLIGDHINDVQAARANGLQAIAVATGVLGEEELRAHRPDLVVPSLLALEWEVLL